MFKRFLILFLVIFLSLQTLAFIIPSVVEGYYTNMSASVVIGQPNFVSNTANNGGVTASSMNGTLLTFSDGQRLYVSDFGNNRVLVWNHIPTQSNTPADFVLGQPDLVSSTANNGGISASTLSNPGYIYSDGTKLAVADLSNNRVLIWNSIPTRNQQPADVVVGQPDFITSSAGTSAVKMKLPLGVLLYNNKLITLEIGNAGSNRALIFNSVPTTNGASADVVVGQPDFITKTPLTTNSAMVDPRGIGIVNGKLLIADAGSNRVLIWNSIPTANGVSADGVIGQTNFTSSGADTGGVTCSTLNSPNGILALSNGRVLIGDTHRVLIFNQLPTTNGATADLVLGQPDCSTRTDNNGGISARSISGNNRGGSEVGNKLIIADSGNSRVLIYNNIIDTPQMNINLPLEKIDDTYLRVRGNVQLGDRPNYSLQWIKAEVNGQGLGYVTNLGGGRDNGTNNTLYDFFHEFNPTTGVNTDTNNYTLKLVASSFNADTTSLFYFQPFNFDYIRRNSTNLNISFHVNSTQIPKIKDNVDHFEIQTSTDSGKFWKKYSTNISTDKIDTNSGQVYVTTPNTLLPGIKYWTRIIAVSRDSNWQQPSNIQNYFVPRKK